MNIEAEPIMGSQCSPHLTDIAELTLGPSGLRIAVLIAAKGGKEDEYLEVFFTQPRGFRFLDEGDLIRYWESGAFSVQGNLVYEIKSGGWMMQELQIEGMLTNTHAFGGHREWLVVTANGCVNVISRIAPILRKV